MSPPADKKPPPGVSKGPARLMGDFEDLPTKIGSIDKLQKSPQAPRDRAHLIVLAGENLGQMFRIEQAETIIGRATDATIRLQDDGVSRRHARIYQSGGQLWIEDMKSANGTIINGERSERTLLRDGDKIQIGSTMILKFTYADELDESFQQKMYDAALHDGLTHAFNKRHFLDRLPTEVAYARRHKAPLSLLMLDVDHFKRVNDSYGHLAGDHVLVTLAQVVAGVVRTEDLFARYGGEEFCILCRGVALANAALLGERLRDVIASAVFEYHGKRIPITVSIGVAAASDQPDTAIQLIADADAALYQAKREGRNRVVCHAARGAGA